MQTFDIIDGVTGAVLRTTTVDMTIHPVLQDGETARLTHVDGEPVLEGEPLSLTDEERARLPKLGPVEPGAEAVSGTSDLATYIGVEGTRPDEAQPGVQVAPAEGAKPVVVEPAPEQRAK